jgi:hypothetical protein
VLSQYNTGTELGVLTTKFQARTTEGCRLEISGEVGVVRSVTLIGFDHATAEVHDPSQVKRPCDDGSLSVIRTSAAELVYQFTRTTDGWRISGSFASVTGAPVANNVVSQGIQNTAITESEAADFIQTWMSAGESDDIDTKMDLYADRVIYYSAGSVNQDYLRADKLKYFRRWPQRQYRRTSNLKTLRSTANLRTLRFDYAYNVSNSDKTASGVAWTIMTLERMSGGLVISEERGAVYR